MVAVLGKAAVFGAIAAATIAVVVVAQPNPHKNNNNLSHCFFRFFCGTAIGNASGISDITVRDIQSDLYQ